MMKDLPEEIEARVTDLISATVFFAQSPKDSELKDQANHAEIALKITILRYLPGVIGDAARARREAKEKAS